MLSCVEIAKLKPTPENIARRKFPIKLLNAVLLEETGDLLEIWHFIKNPKYREVWGISYENELGKLSQRISGLVEGTNTVMLTNKEDTQTSCWQDVTYGIVVVSYRQKNNTPTEPDCQ